MAQDFINHLEWRSAIKVFDETKKVSEADLNTIYKAIQLAPSSFGLQPFCVKVVKDSSTLQKMCEAGWGQKQFVTCTAALVFVARADINERIESYFQTASQGNPQVRAQMKDYESMVKGWAQGKSTDEITHWAQKQIYIALGFALAACAQLGVDSCPMEGFDAQKFNAILSLPSHHTSSVVLTVGYRTPTSPPYPKVRFPMENLVQF